MSTSNLLVVFQGSMEFSHAYLSQQTQTNTPSSQVKLSYNGGPVIENVVVNPIFFNGTQYTHELAEYYNLLAWCAVQEYATPTQVIGLGTFGKAIVETSVEKNALDDILDVQPFIRSLVEAGRISPTTNSYYPIHYPPGITITMGGGTSCDAFGGYHSMLKADYAYVADISAEVEYVWYAVLPNCGPFDSVNDLLDAVSHELAEAISDPIPGNSWYNNNPDAFNGEIGDICVDMGTTIKDNNGNIWETQLLWSNIAKKCTVGTRVQRKPSTVVHAATENFYIENNGGPLLSNVEITPVFYGPSISYISEIEAFYSWLVASPFFDALAEYSTDKFPIGHGKRVQSFYASEIKYLEIDDAADIQPFLREKVKQGIFVPNTNSLYQIHISPDMNLTFYGSLLCPDICSYSSDISATSFLYYSVIPDLTPQSKCFNMCGLSPNPLHNTESLASMNVANAVTNPAMAVSEPGWYTSTGIASKSDCAWDDFPFHASNSDVFVVQKFWSNRHQQV
ncbi:hypothetical protein HDU83_000403 [Entophlyctis luteolus]|nr:hypothetical protein HDU83_000403 [Entophlyctis luteolus]